MLPKFPLDARFDLQGAFWSPDTPTERFTGRLARNAGDIELTTSPILKVPEGLRDIIDRSPANIPLLHGFTTEGECTLFYLQSLQLDGLTDFRTMQSLTYRQFRVGLCVFGLHMPSSSTPFISSACFGYSGLNEWIPTRPHYSETSDSVSLTFAKDAPPIFDVCAINIRSRISFDIIPFLNQRSSGEFGTTNLVHLIVEPAELKSIEWILDIGDRFENLFSLLLGTSVTLQSAAVNKEDHTAWLTRRVRQKKQKVDPMAWVRCKDSELASAVLLWLSTPEEFRSLENLIYGTIRNSSLFVETEFLSLAQAIESLHRLTDASTVADRTCFKDVLESLTAEIDFLCGDTELRTRLEESIQHANEPNFRKRIQGLLGRLNSDQRLKLIGDEAEFEQILRQTRNSLTHPGIRKGSKVLTGTKEIFLFNQKLHAFLRFLMLIGIGFSGDEVLEPVLRRMRKWR
jgi:hypothetical protein